MSLYKGMGKEADITAAVRESDGSLGGDKLTRWSGTSFFGKYVSSSTVVLMAVSTLVLLIDQVTKSIARSELIPGQPVRVIPGFLDFSISYNTGAAFGILPNATPLLVIIGFVLIFSIVRLRSIGKQTVGLRLGLGLLLGGATGNLIDRTIPPHTVTDFISLHAEVAGVVHSWPNFNLADVAIVLGVIIVIYGVHRLDRGEPHQ